MVSEQTKKIFELEAGVLLLVIGRPRQYDWHSPHGGLRRERLRLRIDLEAPRLDVIADRAPVADHEGEVARETVDSQWELTSSVM